MVVIYAEKSSLAKTIASVLHAGQRIPLKAVRTVENYCQDFQQSVNVLIVSSI